MLLKYNPEKRQLHRFDLWLNLVVVCSLLDWYNVDLDGLLIGLGFKNQYTYILYLILALNNHFSLIPVYAIELKCNKIMWIIFFVNQFFGMHLTDIYFVDQVYLFIYIFFLYVRCSCCLPSRTKNCKLRSAHTHIDRLKC